MRSNTRKIINRAVIYILAALIVIYVLAPYLWLIISSISTKADLLKVPLNWIPRKPTLENYYTILAGTSSSTTDAASQFKYALANSAVVAISVTALSMVVGLLAAYAFARMRFRFKKPSFYLILLTQMVPPIALIIPMYMLLLKFNMMDKKISLIIVYLSLVLPFVIWIMKGYLASIPVELEESARIDGCSRMKSFVRIILPLASPGLAATTIFAFIIAWNEFFYALNFTSTIRAKTLPVVITEFSSKHGADYIMTSTGGVIASLPPVLLALVFQKYIIAGLTAGAIKG
ncbi:MAG TPA: carbohydrate ABC transporter permease [Clostridiaceae bacterium]|nr:carbohydrate ABC transporter permease [Clostridiaceae bacterium]